jgi:hypothetical protein
MSLLKDPGKRLIRGLPQVKNSAVNKSIEQVRICDKCHQEGQVISNSSGINVFCNTCKRWWPISSTPLSASIPPQMGRGLSKMTWVEPDWNMADDPSTGDVTNEQIGPKKHGY